MGIRAYVEGLDQKQKGLLELGLAMRDLRPFWPRLIPVYISWVGEQFDSEGQFFGSGWEPLSPEYAAWKSVAFPGKRILSMMGPLRQAATSPTRYPGPLMLELRIEPYEHPPLPGRSSGGGTLEPSWFQEGTATMPARPILSSLLPARARVELDHVAEQYAHDTIRRLGL